jgi:hypothetical protein
LPTGTAFCDFTGTTGKGVLEIENGTLELFTVWVHALKKEEEDLAFLAASQPNEVFGVDDPETRVLDGYCGDSAISCKGLEENALQTEIEERRARKGHAHISHPPVELTGTGDIQVAGLEQPGCTGKESSSNRALIKDFIGKVFESTGEKITRREISSLAGYNSRSELQRFQSESSRCTEAARRNFNRVLGMTPEDFIFSLEKRKKLPTK